MSDTPTDQSPQRMSTRNQVRVNYTEMVSGNSSGDREPVFRSPTASTRGRKKRPINADISDLSNSFGNLNTPPPKRGRPRGGGFGSARGGRVPMVRRTTTEEAPEAEERELVAAVKSGKKITEAVDKWIGRYNEKFLVAIAEMHQFFFAICGCKGTVTPQMSATLSFKEIICRMTEDFEEESADYPLVHGGSLKKVRANLHTFIHTLISRIKSSMIFDSNLMDGFVQLLTGMADSQVRAFRHTATYCAMKVTSALVDVTIELTNSKEKTLKQIEAERAKLKNNSAGNEKYEALVAQMTQTDEKAEEIRQIIAYLFRSVFVHRYRDVVPDIRSICIQELGHWMDVYPEHFVDDSYLKYIGWSLFDKLGDVRVHCVRALIPLFDKEQILDKLELFVNKFKDRLVSMLLDKDLETSVETVNLMRHVYTAFPSLLSIKDTVPLYELVYASNRQLAVAAGQFLTAKVLLNAEKPGKTPNANNVPLINDLTTFFMEGDLHEHGTYLVDALFDINPIIKDWATMADILLSDKNEMKSEKETRLIEILSCSIAQSATGEPPVGRVNVKKNAMTAKESRDLIEDRARLTEIMIPLIPRLLTKYSSDDEKIISLISIPLHFQMDMYLSARMQPHLIELMDALDSLVEKHIDEDLLRGVAELYYHVTNHTTISSVVESHKMKLLDGIAAYIRKSMQKMDDGHQFDDEEEALFASYIKRMAAFAGYMDLRHWNLWDILLKIVANYELENTLRDVRERAMQMLFIQMVFDLSNMRREGETPKADQIRKLKKRRDQLINILSDTLLSAACGVEQAWLAICDLMLLFGKQLTEDSKVFEPLTWRPDINLLANIKNYLSANVFEATIPEDMEQQERIELMHKQRSLVATFSKLIIHGAMEVREASELIKRYQSHFAEFGDIFKNLLTKCREIDFVETGMMIVEALKSRYTEMEEAQQRDPLSEPFNACRDLAKRLGPAFGSDYAKNRYAVTSLHKEAIDFAFDEYEKDIDPIPKNIFFLEIAIDFSGKLLQQDKVAVVRYLNKVYSNRVGTSENSWEPYNMYLASLTDRNDDDNMSVRSGMTVASNATSRSTASSTRGRGRGRRARIVDDF
ncbi:CBN-SCC-3 protein [Caenorhabditis brenneri]|uniref:CBN-SCC-3 protein n=1 Tax=Caenorhabditis brenneri TaxID=135651 RepID=G0MTW9_CAEBE|nr:CBN-SCC-3 protein [Caenorhabditis brenneri]